MSVQNRQLVRLSLLTVVAYTGISWATVNVLPESMQSNVLDTALAIGGPVAIVGLFASVRPEKWRVAPILIAVAPLGFVAGRVLTAFGLAQNPMYGPPISPADLGYLLARALVLAGILMLPNHLPSRVSRPRLMLDSVLVMTVVASFSWYFGFGPVVLRHGQPALSAVLATVYPLSELLLVSCLLAVTIGSGIRSIRRASPILLVGLILLTVFDSASDYRILQTVQVNLHLLDPLRALGWMLVGLAGFVLWSNSEHDSVRERSIMARSRARDLWLPLFPYLLLPAMVALVLHVWLTHGDARLALGVYLGAIVLMALVFFHQVALIAENAEVTGHLERMRQRRILELATRGSEERFRGLVQGMPVGVVLIDTNGRIAAGNEAATSMLGLPKGDVVGRVYVSPGDSDTGDPSPPGSPEQRAIAEAFRTGKPVRNVLVERVAASSDTPQIMLADAVPSVTEGGRVEHVICTLTDVTEWWAAEAALKHQALHDTLTGLPNRSLLSDRANQAILTSHRTRESFALLLVDVDRFKEINESFGHAQGDAVLRHLSARLLKSVRESDTVARLDGDEFAIILPNADEDGAVERSTRILKAIHEPLLVEGQRFTIDASVGISLFPEHSRDVHALLHHADVAMKIAKRAHSGYALYSPEEDTTTPMRLVLLGELRQAIDHGDLLLHYQPKLCLTSGRVESVEALVRWPHPSRGLLAPDNFVPLAESTGLIADLDLEVVRLALEQCAAWRSSAVQLRVAVNLSPRHLHDRDLIRSIATLLAEYRLPATYLEIEVTESVIMSDPDRSLAILTRLREMGVRIGIDDFGIGYSSLSYLQRLPADEIKIDKSFVRDLASGGEGGFIARSVIDLAHELRRQVVAEGVEDQETLDALSRMGCDLVQGRYVSWPLPPDQLLRRLEEFGTISPRPSPRGQITA